MLQPVITLSVFQTAVTDEYQSGGAIQFVKKMRQKLGYPHILLDTERLRVLKELYFEKLVFTQEYLDYFAKRKYIFQEDRFT